MDKTEFMKKTKYKLIGTIWGKSSRCKVEVKETAFIHNCLWYTDAVQRSCLQIAIKWPFCLCQL